jgi:hypothetical protein
MESLKRLVCPLILGLSLVLAVGVIASQATPQGVNSGQHFLPPFESARDRFGFDSGSVSGYDVSLLNAGWYSNWGASVTPPHPDQLVYVQLVRFDAGSDPHDPGQVKFSPGKATIAQVAAANPGSLWLLANEPDSVYQGSPIYPNVYAIAYHDLYAYIKGLDPSALIANGGIVQPTPCRLAYLDIVWDTYLATFGFPLIPAFLERPSQFSHRTFVDLVFCSALHLVSSNVPRLEDYIRDILHCQINLERQTKEQKQHQSCSQKSSKLN